MLLAVDVGNTHTTFGIFTETALLANWRISTSSRRTADEWGFVFQGLFQERGMDKVSLERAIVSCVVPPVTNTLVDLFQNHWQIDSHAIGPGTRTGLSIRADAKEVGADRIVNAVSASNRYSGDLIIVDFGTATTFDAVTGQREYLGGAFFPGIGIATEAFYEKTAKLPRIDIEIPQRVIGRTTVEAMHAGIFYGYVGMTRELIRMIREDFSPQARVIGTGGWGYLLSRHCEAIDHFDPFLTLEGLRIIDGLNRGT
ncbi:MAG TPA: type III pantothenate kinase [Atribacteraceae bacterium]|nr:type III pantothenate kinase [Atribacteraceae bacterium]